MAARKKPIRLSPDEDGLLRKVYVQFRIPRDQFKKRPADLVAFIDRWCKLSGRDDVSGEVIRYIRNQQKAKTRLLVHGIDPWPTFDGGHKRAPECGGQLDEKKLAILREVYEALVLPLGIGVDLVEANVELCDEIAKQFAKRAGVIIPALTLIAIAEEKRKRGLWCKVGRHGFGRGMGFDDMDQLDKADDLDT